MTDLIAVAVIVLIIALASLYIYKAKKRGQKCIGCPYANSCGAGNDKCSCGSDNAHS